VYYQRLFLRGPGSELFEVARGLNLDQSRSQDHGSQARLQATIDAFQRKGNGVRSQEAGRINAENDFTAPNPWLRRLGSALHLKGFSGKKAFLRDLISMEYEVDPNDCWNNWELPPHFRVTSQSPRLKVESPRWNRMGYIPLGSSHHDNNNNNLDFINHTQHHCAIQHLVNSFRCLTPVFLLL
jgi:hypothetical protein